MSNSDNCPNCDNIYGNEPRKIPCGHIVCHKCCLELFNKEDNTLECPVCSTVHTFKSKNTFKKSLQQVAHSGFGKKTSMREMSFASSMPVEKASGTEKSANKEVKKAAAKTPTAPPDVSSIAPPPAAPVVPVSEPVVMTPQPPPPPPVPLMSTGSPLLEHRPYPSKPKQQQQQQNTSHMAHPPSLLQKIILPPSLSTPTPPPPPSACISTSDAVIARCHSCGNKCQVIVCDHCDHFVCLKCAEEHRVTTITAAATPQINVHDLANKWHACKNKYHSVLQKLNQYNRDKTQIESDLAAIRVAVEQRTRDAITSVTDQRDSLIARIDEHIHDEQTTNSIKHNELANEFRQIQSRLESALDGEDIGSYTQENFLRDIHDLQHRMNQRNDLIETHILKIPTISRYEHVPIEKLLGELQFDQHTKNGLPHSSIPSLFAHPRSPKQNGVLESPPVSSIAVLTQPTPTMSARAAAVSRNTITPPSHLITTATPAREPPMVKPLMAEANVVANAGEFDEFRRMAALIHQQFNAPYSKVINAASSPSSGPTVPAAVTETIHTNGTSDRHTRASPATAPSKSSTGTFTKSWKIEHSAVPNFLCMTPAPSPKVFVLDKYGKVSVGSIPPKPIKPIESYTLFPNGTDEWIESVVASSHFLIVYSRKKQDTMTGTMYFFNHECKLVSPIGGIHQSIPVHHLLCDQNANRLYCLDRMRCTIYFHALPNNAADIETCMKTRRDFIQFNSSYTALKMLQNDEILGFYERNDCTVHLYDKQTAEKLSDFKCEHFMDKFESWGIIAIRKDRKSLIFKVDERADQDAVTRQHIVYEVNCATKQVIGKIQLNSVFGMIIGPSNEVILGIRQTKDSGLVQCYVRK